ncbi:MAG: 4Fe-4S binding protein [Treponema sp.]|jgi:fumarate reductase flavoprotein subunit/NADH-quinone oxidoreductase subunit F|nr:4Fe-4S binding protein [Treponema sp.]
MDAIAVAQKMSKVELLERIKNSEIHDYASRITLNEAILRAGNESSALGAPVSLVIALDNSDVSGCLLEILRIEREKFFIGMEIAVLCITDSANYTIRKTLYIPEYAADFAQSLEEDALRHSFNIELGIVDMRSAKGALVIHPATLVMLADYFEGKALGYRYVSVNNRPLQRVEGEAKIATLLDAKNTKALEIGCEFYPQTAASLSINELDIVNGVIRVLTEKECIITETAKILASAQSQHCGKCVFCREGLIQLTSIHKDIMAGKGKMEYLDLIKEIGRAMSAGSFCSLGQRSPLIALSAIEHFMDEYEAHIKKRNCFAGVCISFVAIYIDPDICTGCTECLDICPVDCIEGRRGYIHMIDEKDCTRCGKCIEACPENAVNQTSSKPPKLPDRPTKCGKFRNR